MRTVTYKLADLKKAVIHLGKVAENDATQVRIDAAEVFGDYPAAQVALSVTNPVGETYPATVQRDGDFVVWDVKDSSLTAEGDGEIQIRFSQSGAKIRSEVGKTKICRSIIGEGEAPDPVQDWVDQAEELLEEIENAIPAGGTTGQVLAKASGADFDTEWVDQTGGGGGTGDYEDLENLPQIGGVELKGNKSLHDLGAAAESDIPDVSGFYTKPSGGIPASDIADGVIPDPAALIDDTSTGASKVWSASKTNELKSAFDLFIVEETLLRDELPGTTTTVTLDANGNPTSIVHSADGATVRTDTFVWSTNSVTETRETDEYYITITTNLTTLAQTISEIEEVA